MNPAWKGVLPILIEKFPAIKGILPWLIDEMAGEGASEASIIPTLIEKFPGINATPGLIEGLKDALFPSSNPVNGTPTLSPPVDEKVQGSQALGEASYTEPEGAQGPTGDDGPSEMPETIVIGRGEDSSGPVGGDSGGQGGGDSGGAGGGEPMREGHHEWGADIPAETAAEKQARGLIWAVPTYDKGRPVGYLPGDPIRPGVGPGQWFTKYQLAKNQGVGQKRKDKYGAFDKRKQEEALREKGYFDPTKEYRYYGEDGADVMKTAIAGASQVGTAAVEANIAAEKLRLEKEQFDTAMEISDKQTRIENLREIIRDPNSSREARQRATAALEDILAGGNGTGNGGSGGSGGSGNSQTPSGDYATDLQQHDQQLYDDLTALQWEPTFASSDHGNTGDLFEALMEMLDQKRITDINKESAFGYINSKIGSRIRASIEAHKGGADPAENSMAPLPNEIGTSTEDDLYLFFKAIMANKWPPGYPKP